VEAARRGAAAVREADFSERAKSRRVGKAEEEGLGRSGRAGPGRALSFSSRVYSSLLL
jgi:hypothetical protein